MSARPASVYSFAIFCGFRFIGRLSTLIMLFQRMVELCDGVRWSDFDF